MSKWIALSPKDLDICFYAYFFHLSILMPNLQQKHTFVELSLTIFKPTPSPAPLMIQKSLQ